MAYLPSGTPVPVPGPEDRLFWAACDKRELRIQQCAACLTFRHPPAPICPACRSTETLWTQVPGTGEVFSFTIVRHPVHPIFKDQVPFNVAVILLDGAGDVRLVSNVMDAAPEEMAIGLRVRLQWDETEEGAVLPRFVRDRSAADA